MPVFTMRAHTKPQNAFRAKKMRNRRLKKKGISQHLQTIDPKMCFLSCEISSHFSSEYHQIVVCIKELSQPTGIISVPQVFICSSTHPREIPNNHHHEVLRRLSFRFALGRRPGPSPIWSHLFQVHSILQKCSGLNLNMSKTRVDKTHNSRELLKTQDK